MTDALTVRLRSGNNTLDVDGADGAMLDERQRFALKELAGRLGEALRLPEELRALETRASERLGAAGPVALHALLGLLAEGRALEVGGGAGDSIAFVPYCAAAWLGLLRGDAQSQRWVSRFAVLRPSDRPDEALFECPRAHAHFVVRDPALARSIAQGLLARDTRELGGGRDDAASLLARGMQAGGFLVDEEPRLTEHGLSRELPQWEFQDLYLHSRSRLGRQQGPIGGLYRMARQQGPDPVFKPAAGLRSVALPPPNGALAQVSLGAALEQRRSVRSISALPVTLAEVASFLHCCFAVRAHWSQGGMEMTRRPYPSGGASYDLEVYLLASGVQGLEEGAYHYDPARHALGMVAARNEHMTTMLDDAHRACAYACYPHLVVVLASRFRRVSWKYAGIAYATILKNLGAVYGTMYLVATALGLAPCALGIGNSDTFSRLTGIDYYEEGSVGEFMLARPA